MPAKRRRSGARTSYAAFRKHNGNVDEYGTPTYAATDDWDIVIPAWPAELINTNGGEVLRGRQVSAVTTDVLYGEYYGGSGATPDMQCVVDGVVYEVVSVLDLEGMNREIRVELKREL